MQINNLLDKTLSDYKSVITSGRAHLEKIQQEQGYSAASIIQSIDLLVDQETEWADAKS
jgi:hypothetical protein